MSAVNSSTENFFIDFKLPRQYEMVHKHKLHNGIAQALFREKNEPHLMSVSWASLMFVSHELGTWL